MNKKDNIQPLNMVELKYKVPENENIQNCIE